MTTRVLIRYVFLVAFSLAFGLPAYSAPSTESMGSFRLERVVLLMRHGIRPPTHAPVLPKGYAADPWPKWNTPFGYLTPHGAKAMELLGKYDRAIFAAHGLVSASGCPDKGAISAWADSEERTIKSAQSWLDGFAPGCGLIAGHRVEGVLDPLFSPLDGVVPFDATAAKNAILANLGTRGLSGVLDANGAALRKLQLVLKCCSVDLCAVSGEKAGCSLADLPSAIVIKEKNRRPKLSGPLSIGSTAGETIMLEYTNGMPMKDVGWGRASPADIALMLSLHSSGKFRVLNRAPYIAARGASLLTQRMLQALRGEKGNGSKVTLLLGHDTNIADVAGMLNLHWTASSYPADDVPPGGAIGFALLKDPVGKQFVRVFFQAQTMDQLRNLSPLTLSNPPYRHDIEIPGCEIAKQNDACPLDVFSKTLQAKMVLPPTGTH